MKAIKKWTAVLAVTAICGHWKPLEAQTAISSGSPSGASTITSSATSSPLSVLPQNQQSGEQRTVDGRVRRPMGERGDSTGMGPAAHVWVTLHRVGSDSAGAVDSVLTDGNGRYRMRYKLWGNNDAVYFASSTWDGITYFSARLTSRDARDDEAEITVFDTTSRTFPMTVKGRHFIVSRADSTNQRTIVEVFELSNDSLLSLVSIDTTVLRPTWSTSIPATAIDVRVSEGEISPRAFLAKDGRASVFSPFAPGLKQVVFTYKVPNSSFPLAFTAEGGAVVFEVLLEEPQGSVSGGGFTAVEPVSLEGRNFRRFLAQDVKPGARIVIELPSGNFAGRGLYIAGLLAAVGFLMLLGLARSMQRSVARRSGSASAPSLYQPDASPPTSERLAQEIAALDTTFGKQQNPSPSVVQAYHTRRAELKKALADALGHAVRHDG